MKATDLLKTQHRKVKGLFRRLKRADGRARKSITQEIATNLRTHMEIEETIFYPAVREAHVRNAKAMVPEAYEEHHVVKLVLRELPGLDPRDEQFEAKMTVLSELIDHHVEEEEEEMFPAAEKKLGIERLKALGEEMQARAEARAGN